MFEFLKKMMGGSSTDYRDLVSNGAVILDVRTTGEFQSGHIKGAVNIPVQILPQKLNQLDKNKPIITCCASGMRSGTAKSMLISAGFSQVFNGGSWFDLESKI
jgi:phage shock protein E